MTWSVGNWVVGETIAFGAMGAVYHCRNRLVDIQAALKRVPFRHRSSRDRFLLEVEALFRLGKHPHIVQLLDFGILPDESAGWIVMELLDGEPLPDQMGEDDVLKMLLEIGGALAHAHAHGIYHRDVKPGNLLHTKRRGFVLVDFGIALQDDRTRLTQAGMFVGTLEYSPPELCRPGAENDDGSGWDLYALGQVTYELLVGQRVFPARPGGHDLATVLFYKQDVRPFDPSSVCSSELADLVRHATEPDPTERLGSMDELVARAVALVAGAETTVERPATTGPPLPRSEPLPSPDARTAPRPPPRVSSQGTGYGTSHSLPRGTTAREASRPSVLGGLLGCGALGLASVLIFALVVAAGWQLSVATLQDTQRSEAAGAQAESPTTAALTEVPEDAAVEVPSGVEPSGAAEASSDPQTVPPEPEPEEAASPDASAELPEPEPPVAASPLSKPSAPVPRPEPRVERTPPPPAPEPGADAVAAAAPVVEPPMPREPASRPTRVRLASDRVPGSVELLSADGTRYPLSPRADVNPGRYQLVVVSGSRSISSGFVEVGTSPAVVTCSVAMICRLK